MRIITKLKSKFVTALIVLVMIGAAIWMIFDPTQHIEDTNGADNYSLQTLTENDILADSITALGVETRDDLLSDVVTYSSDKFSGVYLLHSDTYYGTVTITVNHTEVTSGNFRLVAVVNGEIVHDFALNELTQSYTVENMSGKLELIMAGESAAFELDFSVI